MNFWDASGFVKALDPAETHHWRAINLLRQKTIHACCALLIIETRSAIGRKFAPRPDARRRMNERARTALAAFQIHGIDGIVEKAAALADRHLLRAGDAIYLASALEVHSHFTRRLVLIGADIELLQAATKEGLRVQDLS